MSDEIKSTEGRAEWISDIVAVGGRFELVPRSHNDDTFVPWDVLETLDRMRKKPMPNSETCDDLSVSLYIMQVSWLLNEIDRLKRQRSTESEFTAKKFRELQDHWRARVDELQAEVAELKALRSP